MIRNCPKFVIYVYAYILKKMHILLCETLYNVCNIFFIYKLTLTSMKKVKLLLVKNKRPSLIWITICIKIKFLYNAQGNLYAFIHCSEEFQIGELGKNFIWQYQFWIQFVIRGMGLLSTNKTFLFFTWVTVILFTVHISVKRKITNTYSHTP